MVSNWHILTGEYPPQHGGISDYTEQLAAELAREGCSVHVWCPYNGEETRADDRVRVHRIKGGFGLRGLLRLGSALNRFEAPRTLLVQYAPNAFGLRGLNLFVCFWLLFRAIVRRDDARVMFHEPFYYFARQRLRLNLLALAHRLMAIILLASSRITYISTPAWERLLRPFACLRPTRFVWLPISSSIPFCDDEKALAAVRGKLANEKDAKLIAGHFGTYGRQIAPVLSEVFLRLLERHEQLLCVCLGKNADEFVERFRTSHTEFKDRIKAFGFLSSEEVSLRLQACDLVIQPFADGATSRRTSLMAALRNGVPCVSNLGIFSEPLWAESGALLLASSCDAAEIAELATRLLENEKNRAELSSRSKQFYDQQFSIQHSTGTLMDEGRSVAAESKALRAEAR